MKHTAITIGPIYKTIHQVKSTKAIWAASYMFSYLIKELIKKLKIIQEDVILPYFDKEDLTTNFEVGLFPDRVLFKKEIANIENVINEVIDDFAVYVSKDLKENDTELKKFLKDYLHFYHLTVEIPEGENTIFILNEYLDTLELKKKIVADAEKDFLYNFFENIYYNFLIKTEFDKTNQRFPSTIEIAMGEFKKNENEYKKCIQALLKPVKGEDKVNNQKLFIGKIYDVKDFEKTKRNYQKYIAVVQADGDNMGDFIKALYKEPNKDLLIQGFSKNLLTFAKKSVRLIKNYQGTPIYAGGDDLLFICPVAHSVFVEENDKSYVKIEKTFFTLINDIDNEFKHLFTENPTFKDIISKVDKKPSMSYGVSISYYKFPLNQALEQGVNQLFYKAKKTCEKNAVSYAILKHSGHFIGTTFHKNRGSYKLFEKLIQLKVTDENYIRSITYKLEPLESVLYGISIEQNEDVRNKKFDNFFENTFNESIHIKIVNNKKQLIDFLEHIKNLMKCIYTENHIFNQIDDDKKKESNKENLNQVYSALRFVNFINNKEER